MTIKEVSDKLGCRLNRKGLWRCGIVVGSHYGQDRRFNDKFKHLKAPNKIKEGENMVFFYPMDYYDIMAGLIKKFTTKHPQFRKKRKRIKKA